MSSCLLAVKTGNVKSRSGNHVQDSTFISSGYSGKMPPGTLMLVQALLLTS